MEGQIIVAAAYLINFFALAYLYFRQRSRTSRAVKLCEIYCSHFDKLSSHFDELKANYDKLLANYKGVVCNRLNNALDLFYEGSSISKYIVRCSKEEGVQISVGDDDRMVDVDMGVFGEKRD